MSEFSYDSRFQSTLSSRRATTARRRERRTQNISIHALLTESDRRRNTGCRCAKQFQSTLSSRRATDGVGLLEDVLWISIHALLTESDPVSAPIASARENFNPRSPHGERRGRSPGWPVPRRISIHALLTESDVEQLRTSPLGGHISIHALLTESDGSIGSSFTGGGDFNPRSPHGERRSHPLLKTQQAHISIHALLTESDDLKPPPLRPRVISIHALLTESDLRPRIASMGVGNFNPRSPHGERPRLPLHPWGISTDFNPRSPHGERP